MDTAFWNIVAKGTFIGALVILFTLLFTPPSHSADERLIIREDGGGVVSQFIEAIEEIDRRDVPLKIDGRCMSACTLLLNKNLSLDMCITNKASFGFHMPFGINPETGEINYSIPYVTGSQQLWEQMFWGVYPDWVRHELEVRGPVPNVYKGDPPSKMIFINYMTLKQHMRVCS